MGSDFIGQIFDVPIGQGGLVGTRNQALIQPDQLIVARNLSYEGAVLKKEGGAVLYTPSPISGAPSVIGGWDWWPTPTTQRSVIFTSDGHMYKDSGAGTYATTLKSGLTVTAPTMPVFVEGGKEAAANNRKLFCFTADNPVQVLSGDGATTTNLATPPADWAGANPTGGLIAAGRLWGFGNSNDPSRLYYSTTTSHEDFTGAGSGTLSIFPGESERIVGAMLFKGLIVVWKYPVGIYLVDTRDPDTANWTIQRLTSGVGGVSPQGAVISDDDVTFLDASGNFQLLSSIQQFGDFQSKNLSRVTNVYSFVQDNILFSALNLTKAIYYAAKREVHFTLRNISSGATANDVRFVLDLNKQDRYRFRYSDRDVCASIWLRKDANNVQRLVVGDNIGQVWLLDQDSKSKNGVAYSAAFQTAALDFSWVDPKLSTVRKIGQYLEIIAQPTGNFSLSVTVYWDGVAVQTLAFNLGNASNTLGNFVLGTDQLGGDQTINRKRRIIGSGRRLSIAASNADVGGDFSIAQMLVHCLVGDERQGRG